MKDPTSKLASRIGGVCCFAVAIGFAFLACWLFILGEIPEINIGENTAIFFVGASIYGVPLPEWTFYFIPTGLSLAAFVLSFVGLRVIRWNGRANA